MSGHAGAVTQTLAYGPFGAVQGQTGHSPNPLRYTGREQDADTGLYYYRARYYDPQDGRFLSENPPGFAAGDVNSYAYVNNNPINYGEVTRTGYDELNRPMATHSPAPTMLMATSSA